MPHSYYKLPVRLTCVFHVGLPIQLNAPTCNAQPQTIPLNHRLKLILWPILMQNGIITSYIWRLPNFLGFLMMLVRLLQPRCMIWLISMLIFSQSQANLLHKTSSTKTEFLDPEKTIAHHRIQIISKIKLLQVQNDLQGYLKKKVWIQPSTSQYNHPILFICKKTGELRV